MPLTLVHDSEFDLSVAHRGGANPKLKHFYGFDPAAKFQMMTPGSTHVFTVTGGDPAGCSVELDMPGVVSFLNPPEFSSVVGPNRRGMIPLDGGNVGTTNLILKDKSGKQVDKIEIRVVEQKEIKVRFYNLVDDKNRQGVSLPDTDPAFQFSALNQLRDYANRIVSWQCGVSLGMTGTGVLRNLNFAQDPGMQLTSTNSTFSRPPTVTTRPGFTSPLPGRSPADTRMASRKATFACSTRH